MPKRKFNGIKKDRDRNKNEEHVEKPEFAKSILVVRDFKLNPSCPHGPQVCFEKNGKQFYSCSAFRSPRECQKNSEKVQNKQSNSGLAQYLFTDESTDLFSSLIAQLNLSHVLCMGVPSIHAQLIKAGIDSFLLDLDPDMVERNKPDASHYNMCNHYFFESDESYKIFLQKNLKELTIIMDPPFSAKSELLSHVHSLIKGDMESFKCTKLKKKRRKTKDINDDSSNSTSDTTNANCDNDTNCQNFNVIWIAPYFMEGHIKKSNPSFNMSDFQITYTNHSSFCTGKSQSRKNGSPIRFFTNIPLSQIKLPEISYKWCGSCDKYVVKNNWHCDKCGGCTSKDGKTYKHCNSCKKCVKPTWSHCIQCKRCALTVGHTCY